MHLNTEPLRTNQNKLRALCHLRLSKKSGFVLFEKDHHFSYFSIHQPRTGNNMLMSKTPDIIIRLKYYSVSISISFSLAPDAKHSYPFMIFLGP